MENYIVLLVSLNTIMIAVAFGVAIGVFSNKLHSKRNRHVYHAKIANISNGEVWRSIREYVEEGWTVSFFNEESRQIGNQSVLLTIVI